MFLDRLAPFLWQPPAQYLPFCIEGKQYGAIRQDLADVLRRWPDLFEHQSVRDDGSASAESVREARSFRQSKKRETVHLRASLKTPQARSEAILPIVETLHQEGFIPTWVGELFPLVRAFGEPPAALVERAAIHFFGSRAFGVHVNGLVRQGETTFVWVAVRSQDNPLWPGKLDQLVAGGISYGYSPEETVVKEAEEEAGIEAELAQKAVLVSKLDYLQPLPWGLEYGTLFVYDLWLPETFVPQNLDGEVGGFQKIPLTELAELIFESDHFKPNVALVYLDLLLRYGLIPPDHPEHPLLKEKLYREVKLD